MPGPGGSVYTPAPWPGAATAGGAQPASRPGAPGTLNPNPSIPLRPVPPTVPLAQAQWPGGGGVAPINVNVPPSALGRVEGSFQGAYGGLATGAVLSGIVAVICLFVTASANADGAGGAVFLALLFGVVCIAMWVNGYNRAHSSVDVHEHGLVIKKGSTIDSFRYDDVKNVWYRGRQSANTGTTTTSLFSMELTSGRRVAVEAAHFKSEDTLASALFKKLTTSLLSKALLDLQAGKRLSFGAIQVDRQGVSNGRETLPWSEVSGVRASGGTITINRQGKWLSWAQISTERTPNVLVLLVIADAIKGVKAP